MIWTQNIFSSSPTKEFLYYFCFSVKNFIQDDNILFQQLSVIFSLSAQSKTLNTIHTQLFADEAYIADRIHTALLTKANRDVGRCWMDHELVATNNQKWRQESQEKRKHCSNNSTSIYCNPTWRLWHTDRPAAAEIASTHWAACLAHHHHLQTL